MYHIVEQGNSRSADSKYICHASHAYMNYMITLLVPSVAATCNIMSPPPFFPKKKISIIFHVHTCSKHWAVPYYL